MMLQMRHLLCLTRPLCTFPAQIVYRSLAREFLACQRKNTYTGTVPLWNTSLVKHYNLLKPQCVWNRTVGSTSTCLCSTVSRSGFDEEFNTDGEANADPSNKKMEDGETDDTRIQAARLELDVMRNSGVLVPDSIRNEDVEYFSTLDSKKSRKRFVTFLYKKERKKINEKEKRRLAQEERERESPREENLEGPMKNRLFLQLQPQSVVQFDNWRLASAMKFGPKVAYDFSYDEHMKRPETISLVQQLMHAVGANKLAKDPFHILWTGLQGGSTTLREMRRMLGNNFDSLMVSITDQQVQDIFPVEDIVYLTADSPNILRAYNPNKVYVLGALVDSHKILRGVSFAKAKRLNLNHAHLPLDLFLKWGTGGKNLTLDQMIQILIELNTSGDWIKALSHVPTRKHEGLKSERPSNQLGAQREPSQTSIDSLPVETRFSFSRAKNSRTWPVLDDVSFPQSKRIYSFPRKQKARLITENGGDPSNETTYSPFSTELKDGDKHAQWSNKDKQWFED